MENKEILKQLADNPSLLEAVKAAILEHFEFDYTFRPEVTNENLGEVVRAISYARQELEKAFQEIAALKSTKDTPEPPNPAR